MGAMCSPEHPGSTEPSRPLPADALEEALTDELVIGGNGRAVCFDGGSFISIAAHTGALAGLLWCYAKAKGLHDRTMDEIEAQVYLKTATLQKSGFFNRFGTISSSSTGSVFVAEAMYSTKFRKLIEDMADDPDGALDAFEERWLNPWLATFAGDDATFEVFAQLTQHHPDTWLPDILMIGSAWPNTTFSWTAFIETMLEATAGLGPGVRLGDNVEAWAKDKVWLACHSILTPHPSREDPVRGPPSSAGAGAAPATSGVCGSLEGDIPYYPQAEYASMWEADEEETDFYRYTVVGAGDTPLYLPARFAFTMGAPEGDPAPVLYCASTALPPQAAIVWRSNKWYTDWRGRPVSDMLMARSPPLEEFPMLVNESCNLPLAPVVASSCALLGTTPVNAEAASIAEWLRGSLGVWAATGGPTAEGRMDAFSQAEALVAPVRDTLAGDVVSSQQVLDDFAAADLRALLDSTYTDKTGVVNAVATGATNVVAFLVNGMDDVYGLFNCVDGPVQPTTEGNAPPLSFSIFKEPQEDAVLQHDQFLQASVPDGCYALQGIEFGRVSGTTDDCEWQGIPAGRAVRITCINVLVRPFDCTCETFFAADYAQYMRRVVQEVMVTFMHDSNLQISNSIMFDVDILGLSRIRTATIRANPGGA